MAPIAATHELRAMKYADLRDFLAQLERRGELKRVAAEVDPRLEMTEICDRVLKTGGPGEQYRWKPSWTRVFTFSVGSMSR